VKKIFDGNRLRKQNRSILTIKFREFKMKVFVINLQGEILMPCSGRKARLLLESGKAKVIRRGPFTIQLNYGSTGYKQALTLGIDTGHSEVGLSVVSKTKEVFSAVAKMRNDISQKLLRHLATSPKQTAISIRLKKHIQMMRLLLLEAQIRKELKKGAYLKITNGLKTMVKSMKKIEVVFHQKGGDLYMSTNYRTLNHSKFCSYIILFLLFYWECFYRNSEKDY
jgi:hypothetical protein